MTKLIEAIIQAWYRGSK